MGKFFEREMIERPRDLASAPIKIRLTEIEI